MKIFKYLRKRMEQIFAARQQFYTDPKAGANVYSDLYNSLYAYTAPIKVQGEQLGGRIRIFRSTYLQGAVAGSIGDIVMFGKLPIGAVPLPWGNMFFGTGASSSTLKLGLTGNDACFLAATSITTAGSAGLPVFAASGAVLKLTAETDVIGTVAGAGIAAGQKITVWIPYVINSD